jgi:hypothetical protein
MKIVHEKLDRESFLEFSLTPQEYCAIKDYMIISKKCYIHGEETNIGIKLELYAENDDEENEIYL